MLCGRRGKKTKGLLPASETVKNDQKKEDQSPQVVIRTVMKAGEGKSVPIMFSQNLKLSSKSSQLTDMCICRFKQSWKGLHWVQEIFISFQVCGHQHRSSGCKVNLSLAEHFGKHEALLITCNQCVSSRRGESPAPLYFQTFECFSRISFGKAFVCHLTQQHLNLGMGVDQDNFQGKELLLHRIRAIVTLVTG